MTALTGTSHAPPGRAGFTLLEMLVVSLVLIGVLTMVSSTWISFQRQLLSLKARAHLLREAEVLRALLVADWGTGVNASVPSGQALALEFPADSSSTSLENGVTHYSHIVDYALSGSSFFRQDNGATTIPSDPWQMMAARWVGHVDNHYAASSLVHSSAFFSNGPVQSQLDVMMINCTPLAGQIDCNNLLPLFYASAFQPVDTNVVYSSITLTLQGF